MADRTHHATDSNDSPRALDVELGFAPLRDVTPDAARPSVLRAATIPNHVDAREALEFHACKVHDLASSDVALGLDTVGFDVADLRGHETLQRALAHVRASDEVSVDAAAAIRRGLKGSVLRLSSGQRLLVLYVAPEGLIMRSAGPNGLTPRSKRHLSTMNGHDPATSVHGDQDVYGTPVKQILRGAAPWLFHHRSPDGDNVRSPVHVVNIWIPLRQITRPLALMDQRSLDRRRHQLLYALPTESFLDRPRDRRVNDIWTFLHDDSQRWYFSSEIDSSSAYVFETLGTPHGAFVLPGEAETEQRYKLLDRASRAVAEQDDRTLADVHAEERGPAPVPMTTALRGALATMDELLDQIPSIRRRGPSSRELWCERAESAMRRVVRSSIEVRAVALMLPSFGRPQVPPA